MPSTVVEYLGIPVNFAEYVDLGGASAAAMVWRAAAAIELGICSAVLCAIPANFLTPMNPARLPNMGDAVHFGASSFRYGSPQAEFEIPYGYLGQNGPYAQVASMYAAAYGYDERAMAKIVADTRINANHTPGAVFADKPATVDDVLASPLARWQAAQQAGIERVRRYYTESGMLAQYRDVYTSALASPAEGAR